MAELTVEKLFQETKSRLKLTLLNNEASFRRIIKEPDLHRPGLALSGFVDVFTYQRVQIIGNTEIAFLSTLARQACDQTLDRVLSFEIPCIIVTEQNKAPDTLLSAANKNAVSVFRTPLTTTQLMHLLSDYLDDKFAPFETLHGSLVDVYGMGVLFMGRSGIGKSEIALDLVERGHRLVADDIVHVSRKAEDILIGSPSELLEHYMEIRGLGIVDVKRMFGIRAIRKRKRIEVVVQLEEWDESQNYERIGIDDTYTSILNVQVPTVRLPIFPGKNITVIAEVLALNQILKIHGDNSAQVFNERLIATMQGKTKPNVQSMELLDLDYE